MNAALAGLKVLDLSRILAGPYAGQILGDLGADVIKVEPPQGDETRRWGPPFHGENANYFFTANRNKRSTCLDFSKRKDLDHVKKLISQADVLIENFKVGSLKKFAIDYQSLKTQNPKLIYCSITGYGQRGANKKKPGFDAMIQAESGLMSLTGSKDQSCKVGIPTTDLSTGLYAVIAILSALHERTRSGKGQQIDLSLFNVQSSLLSTMAMNFLATKSQPARHSSAHPSIVPYQAFMCSDSEVFIAIGNDQQFTRFSKSLGEDWHEDKRFFSNSSRVSHRQDLIKEITRKLRQKPTAHWLNLFEKEKVPAAPVNQLGDLLSHDNQKEYGLFQYFSDTDIPNIASPIGFSRTPIENYRCPQTELSNELIEFK